jgi:hypothetical protein
MPKHADVRREVQAHFAGSTHASIDDVADFVLANRRTILKKVLEPLLVAKASSEKCTTTDEQDAHVLYDAVCNAIKTIKENLGEV